MGDRHILDVLTTDPTWIRDRVYARLAGYPDMARCWTWVGAKVGQHGSVRLPGGPTALTHRVVWLALRGPISSGLVLDHDGPHGCHNRLCANPTHLQAVTQLVNQHNGPLTNACKTQCPEGHDLTVGNLQPTKARMGRRSCHQCAKRRASEDSRLVTQAAHALGMRRVPYTAIYGFSARVARELIATTTVERKLR